MNPDKSRERSLFFLLSTIARNLDTPNEVKTKFKASIGSLHISEEGENWKISIRNIDDNSEEILVPKSKFSFYPVKSADRYEVNPVVLNRNSAEEVLMFFYGKFNIKVAGKKNFEKVPYKISSSLISLILLSLGIIFAQSELEVLTFAFLTLYVFFALGKLNLRLASNLLSAIGVLAPSFFYLNGNTLANLKWFEILFIILFQILTEILTNIRFKKITHLIVGCVYGLFLIVTLLYPFDNLIASGLVFVILLSWLSHSLRTPKIIREILSPLIFLSFAALALTSVILSPEKVLLFPLVILVAIQNVVVGSSRNPARVGFGVLCLI